MAGELVHRPKYTYVATTVKDFHENLKNSLLLKDDMPNLVSAAPGALYMMGELRLLAFSDNASTVKVAVRDKQSDLLKSSNLSSCLVALVRQGLRAFEDAHKYMNTLHILTPQLFGSTGTWYTIVKVLENPRAARKQLPRELKALQSGLKKCVDAVSKIDDQFEVLRRMAEELEDKANDERAHAGRQSESADIEIEQTQLRSRVTKERKENLSVLLEQLDVEVADATAQYKLAQEENGPWRGLGLGVLAELSNTTLGIVNAAIDIAKDTPEMTIETVRAVGNMRPLAIDGSKAGSQEASRPRRQAISNPAAAQVPPQASPSQQVLDPGLLRAAEVQGHVSTLGRCIRDLTLETLLATARDREGPLQETLQIIRDFEQELISSGGQRVSEANSILQNCLRLGDEILKKAGGQKASQGDSLLVDMWSKRLDGLADRAVRLKAMADAQPGHAFGTDMPILNAIQRGFQSTKDRPIDTAALVERTQMKMLTMKATMEAAQTKYQEKTENLAMQQEKLLELSSKLSQLTTSKATMVVIQTALLDAIRYVDSLQAEISQLGFYFNKIAQIVKHVSDIQAARFLARVDHKIEDSETLLPGLSLADCDAQEIFASLLTLRGYFAVVYQNAAFYDKISSAHLLPAIRDVLRLDITAADPEQEKQAFQQRTEKATQAIREEGLKRQEEIKQWIDANIERISNETIDMPVVSKAFERQRKLVQEGVARAQVKGSEYIVSEIEDGEASDDETEEAPIASCDL